MKLINLRTVGLAMVYFLFVVWSAAAGAQPPDSGVTFEGWSSVGERELPVLSFDAANVEDIFNHDIQAQNVTVDRDGSTRFQLTHNGPLGRQVFAHVRRVEQDDGLTRSVITNIADGSQMEYLSPTVTSPVHNDSRDKGVIDLSIERTIGQDTECPWCWVLGVTITEAMCAATVTLAQYQCRLNCQTLGGVKSFESGVCGMYGAECKCMVDPDRIFDEF